MEVSTGCPRGDDLDLATNMVVRVGFSWYANSRAHASLKQTVMSKTPSVNIRNFFFLFSFDWGISLLFSLRSTLVDRDPRISHERR